MLSISTARKIMGKNFIGQDEFKKMNDFVKLSVPAVMPALSFSESFLKKHCRDFILIMGIKKSAAGRLLTINYLRSFFGTNPSKLEPCFYNQDWYLKEKFASETVLANRWYLVAKKVIPASRGIEPERALRYLPKSAIFPSAILTAFTFFAYYFTSGGEMLWQHDFIWCDDADHNGDRIYTGRYIDSKGINKNGFNIHRHLSIRPCYGAVPIII